MQTKKNSLIIDAYNANPTSMMASVSNFIQLKMPNKILILGDMKELGSEALHEHEIIVEMLKKAGIKDVYLIGECFSDILSDFETFKTVDDFILWLNSNTIVDSTVLIKGSNSMRLKRLVEYL